MPPVAIKKNSVDVIISKISFDTVIPVEYLADPTTYTSKCKPYDIIQGKNPLDDDEYETGEVHGNDASDTKIPDMVPEVPAAAGHGNSRRRKRSLSPWSIKNSHGRVKTENNQPHDGNAGAESLSSAAATGGDTSLHAEHFVSSVSPSPLIDSIKLPCRPGWAAQQLSDSTPYQLLRSRDAEARVKYVLDDDDFVWCRNNEVTPESLQRCITYLEWANVSFLLESTIGADDEKKTKNARGKDLPARKDGSPCALCAKPVDVANSSSSQGSSPSLIQGACGSLGMRCSECDTVAHLQCWYVSSLPRQPESWLCDGCYIASQHKRKYTVRCVVCGRPGGVLLPYRAKGGEANGSGDATADLSAVSRHQSNSSTSVSSDSACHAACALAFPELSIRLCNTVYRRNGLLDMTVRPCVVPSRRFSKQWQSLNCIYCQHASFPCVQCQHPRCYETMHASCAAEAGTLDCYYSDETGNGKASSPTSVATMLPKNIEPDVSFSPNSEEPQWISTPWSGCSTYCRKHYGFTVNNSLGSAALADRSEQAALRLDLTGLLTGTVPRDSTAPPIVKKRGRGRPPVALARLREAEKDLVARLKQYWLQRRQSRRMASATWINEINVTKTRPILCCALRPELIKISASKVRLSHYLCLIPEWQQMLVVGLEGELPLPDDEYDDVQRYRKAVSQTRRSGNTVELFQHMNRVKGNLDTMQQMAEQMKRASGLRIKEIQTEVKWMDHICGWGK